MPTMAPPPPASGLKRAFDQCSSSPVRRRRGTPSVISAGTRISLRVSTSFSTPISSSLGPARHPRPDLRARELAQGVFSNPSRRRLFRLGQTLRGAQGGSVHRRTPLPHGAQSPVHAFFHEVTL